METIESSCTSDEIVCKMETIIDFLENYEKKLGDYSFITLKSNLQSLLDECNDKSRVMLVWKDQYSDVINKIMESIGIIKKYYNDSIKWYFDKRDSMMICEQYLKTEASDQVAFFLDNMVRNQIIYTLDVA